MTEPVIWLNGALVPHSAARLDPLTQGFLFGMGVYDTLLVRHGMPFALDQHFNRLAEGAARLGLRTPGTEILAGAIKEVCQANNLPDARVRITLTAGAWQGIVPPPEAPEVCLVTASPVAPAKPEAVVVTVPWRRNEHSPLAGIKFTACAENILAQRAALADGADEAIFLNSRLDLCEGAFSNVFVVKDDTVLTPPLSSGCLPGVTRSIVLELCREERISCRETAIGTSPLFDSERRHEAFLTTSIRGIQPVCRFDGLPLPAPGEITRILMSRYAGLLEQGTTNEHP